MRAAAQQIGCMRGLSANQAQQQKGRREAGLFSI